MSRIFVAGHRGMVGSSICDQLSKDNDLILKSREELDLIDQSAVNSFFASNKINQVYIAAAKVGGIYANNTYPAEFIYQNIMIQTNIIHAAFKNGIKDLLFLGSSCIYPKNSNQPISEDSLLSGFLEPTNEPYATAKIAGIKLCESYNRQYGKSHGINYKSIMPTNLYGPGDNYHPENSHVIPALIRRFHEAKEENKENVVIWGTGKPLREFLHVDDMADASIFIMNKNMKMLEENNPMCSHINVGSGEEVSIKDLAILISNIIGYQGKISFDKTKPDGIMRKLLNSKKINDLGWKPKISLQKGIKNTYENYKANV